MSFGISRSFQAFSSSSTVLTILALCPTAIAAVNFEVDAGDDSRLLEGKKQYELLQDRLNMPRYGTCWTNAAISLNGQCKTLTETKQSRLAIQLANCFLQHTGQESYKCPEESEISDCTSHMSDRAYDTFREFFMHTQNMCYFLNSQIWNEHTANTIGRLSSTSEKVSDQLSEATNLQQRIIRKQKQSLVNQDNLMKRSSMLTNTMKSSTENVQKLFNEFKITTKEQRLLISDVFDRVAKLQALVLGEFTSFYTLLFYALSALVCFLLTSTPRTISARVWLFGIVTLNAVVERLIVQYSIREDLIIGDSNDLNEVVYTRINVSRKFMAAAAFVLLSVFAYRYKDLNQLNNALLMNIEKQNKEIMTIIEGKPMSMLNGHIPSIASPTSQINQIGYGMNYNVLPILDSVDSNDIDDASDFEDSYSDRSTEGEWSGSESSFVTGRGPSRASTPAIVSGPAIPTVSQLPRKRPAKSRTPLPTRTYNLRSRSNSRSLNTSLQESPDTFARQVYQQLNISRRNGEKLRNILENNLAH